MRAILVTLLLAPAIAVAGPFGFSIQEKRDDFTQSSFIHGSGLKVCQPKGWSYCAVLDLLWYPDNPGEVLVRIERSGEPISMLELSVRMEEGIRTFESSTPVTNVQYDRYLIGDQAFSSANSFFLPVDALESIASDKARGIIRITGTHTTLDLDFYRKASMRGLPIDNLKAFLLRIMRESDPR